MNTLLLPASAEGTAQTAADILKNDGLVAIPTETVYGLAANGLSDAAVQKIFLAKGRPQDNPLILHVAESSDIEKFCVNIPQAAYRLAEAFWPGPLTMVLPARETVPKGTTAGLSTVAVRCPDCAITRQIIRLAGVPLAAPSANLSGKPSTTTAQHVWDDHNGRIDAIVDGGPCRIGVESTIVDLSETRPRLLRPGGITPEQLIAVLGDLIVDKAVTGEIKNDAVVKAPGMKYRHYAPQCEVTIVAGSHERAADYIKKRVLPGDRVLCFEEELPLYEGCSPLSYGREADAETLSAGLFAALRILDDPAVHKVYARCPVGGGIAYAVQNRLKKAAAFSVVDAENTPFILGITGGTGCGKTTLLQALNKKGFLTLDCDAIYHMLLKTDRQMCSEIEEAFPECVTDGCFDRKKLGNIVFTSPEALKKLNEITHPHVYAEIVQKIEHTSCPIALDAIGLFESGLNRLCDRTVAVTAPDALRIARLTARDGISESYALLRIRAQRPQAEFASLCDFVLENAGTQAEFTAKCLAFSEKLDMIKGIYERSSLYDN